VYLQSRLLKRNIGICNSRVDYVETIYITSMELHFPSGVLAPDDARKMLHALRGTAWRSPGCVLWRRRREVILHPHLMLTSTARAR